MNNLKKRWCFRECVFEVINDLNSSVIIDSNWLECPVVSEIDFYPISNNKKQLFKNTIISPEAYPEVVFVKRNSCNWDFSNVSYHEVSQIICTGPKPT